ncbi:hypothetical protein SARC_06683 [Sphaeroforma arctica JP610]|uniref:Biogenesis of lysosome-related organelles complex 1 subunit 7 n=1 Tax=Sphaeroforma arctica JP610 TaxID=667725 RepID=A0A0L0FYC4_9EUKA|nr:hypothetical protein SARC_06683 [Sphaeroforma arctica JP610]KNC80968.1 hypothetical protein SARC_06683 [Sphaeroforma arctica JP610]|eukprot:XP_014154870.1 hypothetical protein SARC_06683 [Sphaeroforma arctica JP610]
MRHVVLRTSFIRKMFCHLSVDAILIVSLSHTTHFISSGLKSALLPLAAALEEASGQVTQSQLQVGSDIDRLEIEIEKFMKNYTLPSDCEQQLKKLESFKQRLNTVVHRMSGVQNRIDNMTRSIDKTTQRRKWQLGGFSM